jgi:NADPH-ferrihemoprotein reductase
MELSNTEHLPSQELLHQVVSSIKSISTIDIVAFAITALIAGVYFLKGIAWDRPDHYFHIYFERPQEGESGGNSENPSQRNIARKLEETKKTAVILWGSQSGTAERFANQLAKECHQRFGLDTLSADLSDYEPHTIAEISENHLVILILSTYGEGDPSDNACGFWNWIRSGPIASLSNLKYAAFGLGNSNYKYYNKVVDVVVAELNDRGAKLFLQVGKADDAQQSTEEDFLSWKDGLFQVFRADMQLQERITEYEPEIKAVEDESLTPIDLHHGEPSHSRDNPKSAAACSTIKALTVRSSRELFNSPDRNCVHLELDLSDHPEIHYKTGDHLAVWPSNPVEEVNLLLSTLGLSDRQDVPISLSPVDSSTKLRFPTPTTLRALFNHYLEISAPLSRTTIQGLATFAPNAEAKTLISQLGQDKAFYSDYLTSNHLTFGRLLHLASPSEPWINLPLSYLLEALSPLQPRYYSISSSSVLSPRKAAITVLVAADPLAGDHKQQIKGVTSNYLLALSQINEDPSSGATDRRTVDLPRYNLAGPSDVLQGTRLFAHVRKSKFKLPIQSSCPIIMVAAGTGLAPFRAFIAERAKLHAVGKPIGDMVLFFGCRKPEEDFIYQEELEQMQSSLPDGKLSIITAYSRIPGQPNKCYVQHKVQEHGAYLLSLLEEQGASFYICGRASMAREVGICLGEEAKQIKGWVDSQVKDWSEALKRRGKWREDVWG